MEVTLIQNGNDRQYKEMEDAKEPSDHTQDRELNVHADQDFPVTPEEGTRNIETYQRKAKVNQFGLRKKIAQSMIDLALFAANISQLRILLKCGEEKIEFYYVLLTFIVISLAGQIAFVIIMVIIFEREKAECPATDCGATMECSGEGAGGKDKVVDNLNCASVLIVFIVTVINVCISGFGIGLKEPPNLKDQTGV